MAGLHDAEEYFDLIVECAKKLMDERPKDKGPETYWRELTGKAWRNVHQHMTRPDQQYNVWNGKLHRRELALRFAALSRMAAMAAWWFGIQDKDGEDDPLHVAKRFVEMRSETTPKIR